MDWTLVDWTYEWPALHTIPGYEKSSTNGMVSFHIETKLRQGGIERNPFISWLRNRINKKTVNWFDTSVTPNLNSMVDYCRLPFYFTFVTLWLSLGLSAPADKTRLFLTKLWTYPVTTNVCSVCCICIKFQSRWIPSARELFIIPANTVCQRIPPAISRIYPNSFCNRRQFLPFL